MNKKMPPQTEEFFSLKKIIALMPGNVFWKNRNGVYFGCNNNVAKFFQLNTPDDIIGKRNQDIMPKDVADALDIADLKIMQDGRAHFFEEKGIDKNGRPAIFYSQKSPLFDENGNVIGLLGIAIDITERKKMEEELRIAKEQAEASDKAKSQFMAVINHELRTPLTGIIGLVNLLKKRNLSREERFHTIHDLENCTDHLLNLVNDVLDFTRLESDKVTTNKTSVSISDIINEVTGIMTGLAKTKKIDVTVNCDPALPSLVLTDKRCLRQVLLNLVNNAVKYTESGSINIHTYTQFPSENEADISISITDTGPGIPNDKLNNIFEPFQQLEDTYLRQSSRSGTGLGLAIVKRFCGVLGLEINVKSDLGKGSTFTIRGRFQLPTGLSYSLELPKRTQTAFTSPPRVLLIEDDEIVLYVHKNMLEKMGCEVTTAAFGLEALDKLAGQQLALVDIGLTDITGFEVIRRIRASDYADLPIVVLTGYTGHSERTACLTAGANSVAPKPITAQDLKELIAQYVK